MKRLSLLAVLPLLAFMPGAAPDSWVPFQDSREVSMTGRRYMVIRETGLKKGSRKTIGIDFEICERRAGASAIGQVSKPPFPLESSVDISRDPKDRLVAIGHVDQLPLEVRVLDKLGGFVLFEQYYSIGYGKAVIYVDDEGTVVVNKTVREIYGGLPEGSWMSVSSIHWSQDFWVDEETRSVVVVSNGNEAREISLVDGKVGTPSLASLISRFHVGVDADRELAIELVSHLDAADLKIASPHALRLAEDEHQPVGIRIRAAVLATRAGSTGDFKDLFVDAALAESSGSQMKYTRRIRSYAIAHLPEMMGEKAIPVLRTLMGEQVWEVTSTCPRAFAQLGDAAVPTLCEMILEEGRGSGYRSSVARALQSIGSSKAIPALEKAFANTRETAMEYHALWLAIQSCKK